MEALLGVLPFLLILLICPLLMFFMHGGRGRGGHQEDTSIPQPGAAVGPGASSETAHDHGRMGS